MSSKKIITPREASEILALLEAGHTKTEVANAYNRSRDSVHRVKKYPEYYAMGSKQRKQKGLTLPLTKAEARKQSLRMPAQPKPETPRFDSQISDSQVSFDFAVALLRKATRIVEALARQQHPPELMALVSETIQAAVKLQVQNQLAESMAPADYSLNGEEMIQ